jgi:hypothetical protein
LRIATILSQYLIISMQQSRNSGARKDILPFMVLELYEAPLLIGGADDYRREYFIFE